MKSGVWRLWAIVPRILPPILALTLLNVFFLFMMPVFLEPPIRGLIREGVLVSRAAPEIKLHEAAEDGNIDAVKLLAEIQERRLFENLLKDMDEYE